MQNGDSVLEAKPIKSLEDLLLWSLEDVHPKLMGKPMTSAVHQKAKNQPKTLVCHDMRGNYLEDRFPNGCSVDSAYYITQWSYVDIFVYFSHNLITVPPVGWINAAHSHGVFVLGTFITEFDDGFKICQQFLYDRSIIDKICRSLADIALVYQFDGWLLNIENKIEADQIDNLLYFVNRLSELCKSKLGKSGLVVWYDSVTVNGELKWQNELNSLNKPFFALCDAIFLNYTWNEKNLRKSLLEAEKRSADVFVGVDVFGRNCYGGGGYNCRKALKIIKKYQLSTAIFAPGWVFESQSQTKNFEQSQWNFWFLLSPFVECNKIKSLPFQTNFNPGKYYREAAMFLQLSDQNVQPHWFCSPEYRKASTEMVRAECDSDDQPDVCPTVPNSTMRHVYCRESPGYVLCVRACSDSQVVRLFCCDIILSKANVRVSLLSSSISSLKQLDNYKNISFGLILTVVVGEKQENYTYAYLPSNGKKIDASAVFSKETTHFVQMPLELTLNKNDKTIEISAVLQKKIDASLRSVNLYFNDKNTYLSLLKCSINSCG